MLTHQCINAVQGRAGNADVVPSRQSHACCISALQLILRRTMQPSSMEALALPVQHASQDRSPVPHQHRHSLSYYAATVPSKQCGA